MYEYVKPEDLIDAAGVAEIIGLGSREAVSVYRHRYADFPLPIIHLSVCRLWHRADVEDWARRTGRLDR